MEDTSNLQHCRSAGERKCVMMSKNVPLQVRRMCVDTHRGYVRANEWQTTLSGWPDCANPLSPWVLGCPTGDTQVADPWLTLASCRQAVTASSTGQEAGNMSDFKTNKMTHTTALLRRSQRERAGCGGATRAGNENSRTSSYTEATESDRAQHLCYF